MKRLLIVAVLTALSASLAFGQRTAVRSSGRSNVQEQLIKLDQEWATATARGDIKTLNRILADDYVYTDLDGRTGTKAEMLKDIRTNTAMGHDSITADDYQVRVYGNTAIMTHRATSSGQQPGTELRSIHVWVNRGRGWQVAAHQWTVVTQQPRSNTSPNFNARCAKYSYQPEVISYFGDSSTVIGKLDRDQMGLPDRRGYLLLIETKNSAEFSFFEKADEQHVKVYQWQGASLGDLREQLTNVILENRGIACVGAQTKSIVEAKFNPADLGAIPTPLSARAAFSHILKKYGDQYLRVTILLLC